MVSASWVYVLEGSGRKSSLARSVTRPFSAVAGERRARNSSAGRLRSPGNGQKETIKTFLTQTFRPGNSADRAFLLSVVLFPWSFVVKSGRVLFFRRRTDTERRTEIIRVITTEPSRTAKTPNLLDCPPGGFRHCPRSANKSAKPPIPLMRTHQSRSTSFLGAQLLY